MRGLKREGLAGWEGWRSDHKRACEPRGPPGCLPSLPPASAPSPISLSVAHLPLPLTLTVRPWISQLSRCVGVSPGLWRSEHLGVLVVCHCALSDKLSDSPAQPDKQGRSEVPGLHLSPRAFGGRCLAGRSPVPFFCCCSFLLSSDFTFSCGCGHNVPFWEPGHTSAGSWDVLPESALGPGSLWGTEVPAFCLRLGREGLVCWPVAGHTQAGPYLLI